VTEKIVGIDVGGDGWTVEIVGEVQPDGTLLIVSEHRHRMTIDLEPARDDMADAFGYLAHVAGQGAKV
jgi:hypothetical protein